MGEMMWYRMYHAVLWDAKVRSLTPTQRWLWVAVMAIASKSNPRGTLAVDTTQEIAAAAAVSWSSTRRAIDRFETLGLIVRDNGRWRVTNWDRKQRHPGNPSGAT
jgi:DNA-binding MarR family transcriptional regulator